MAKEKNVGKKSQTDQQKEEEKLRLLANTENVKGEQLFLKEDGNFEKAKELRELVYANA